MKMTRTHEGNNTHEGCSKVSATCWWIEVTGSMRSIPKSDRRATAFRSSTVCRTSYDMRDEESATRSWAGR